MAGLESEKAAGGGRGRLRASHADREHVIDTLKAAYVYGLVTKDELEARVSQTLASRTYADLALVTADIPAGLAAAPPPAHAPATGDAPAGANVRPGDRAIIATATFAGPALVASVFTANPVAGSLVIGATGSAFVSLFLLGKQMRRSRRENRPGGQLPPQRAVHTGPGAGRRAASAASAEQLPSADPGAPLGTAKTISPGSVTDGAAPGPFNGFSILDAPDLDSAVDLVRAHPYVERGGSLQVSEAVAP